MAIEQQDMTITYWPKIWACAIITNPSKNIIFDERMNEFPVD